MRAAGSRSSSVTPGAALPAVPWNPAPRPPARGPAGADSGRRPALAPTGLPTRLPEGQRGARPARGPHPGPLGGRRSLLLRGGPVVPLAPQAGAERLGVEPLVAGLVQQTGEDVLGVGVECQPEGDPGGGLVARGPGRPAREGEGRGGVLLVGRDTAPGQ